MIFIMLTAKDSFISHEMRSLESSVHAVPSLVLFRRTTENHSMRNNLCVKQNGFYREMRAGSTDVKTVVNNQ